MSCMLSQLRMVTCNGKNYKVKATYALILARLSLMVLQLKLLMILLTIKQNFQSKCLSVLLLFVVNFGSFSLDRLLFQYEM